MAGSMEPCASWHSSQEFENLVREFHNRCARSPAESNMRAAKEHLTRLLTDIRNLLQSKGVVSELNFQGSAYEGIKTMYSTLEFDCMVVLANGKHIKRNKDGCPPGFARLEISNMDSPLVKSWKITEPSCNGLQLSAKRVKEKFYSEMTKVINQLGRQSEIKLRCHGPAVQMDVYQAGDRSTVWYSVDMVSGFREKGGETYVAKSDASDTSLFRQSFSQEEKSILATVDRGNHCRKEVIRVVKTIREVDTPLRKLETYVIKTTLLHMIEDEADLDWNRCNRGRRLVDMLRRLQHYLATERLPHRFAPQMNLLSAPTYNAHNLSNMAYRIKRLLNSETEMRKILATDLQQEPTTEDKDLSNFCSNLASFDPFEISATPASHVHSFSTPTLRHSVSPRSSRPAASNDSMKEEADSGVGLGWKILGGTLLGLAAVGVGAAIAEAVEDNKAKKNKK